MMKKGEAEAAVLEYTARKLLEYLPKHSAPKVWNKHDENTPAGAVYVGRPGPYGNPFVIGKDGTREEVIEKFRKYAERKLLDLSELRGKHLVCWCAPLPCHADVLLELANS